MAKDDNRRWNDGIMVKGVMRLAEIVIAVGVLGGVFYGLGSMKWMEKDKAVEVHTTIKTDIAEIKGDIKVQNVKLDNLGTGIQDIKEALRNGRRPHR